MSEHVDARAHCSFLLLASYKDTEVQDLIAQYPTVENIREVLLQKVRDWVDRVLTPEPQVGNPITIASSSQQPEATASVSFSGNHENQEQLASTAEATGGSSNGRKKKRKNRRSKKKFRVSSSSDSGSGFPPKTRAGKNLAANQNGNRYGESAGTLHSEEIGSVSPCAYTCAYCCRVKFKLAANKQ